VLSRIAACTAVFNFFSAMATAVFLLYAVRELGLAPRSLGLLFSLAAAGFVAGASVSGRLGQRYGVGPVLGAAAVVQALPFLLVPVAPRHHPLPLFLVALAVEALGSAVFNVTQISLRQAVTPDHLQGRMNASMRFFIWGTLPLGSLLGGALGSSIGLRSTLWVAAFGSVTSAAPVLFGPVTRLRDMPTATGAVPPGPQAVAGAVPLRPLPDPDDIP
jgi:MFS family permease